MQINKLDQSLTFAVSLEFPGDIEATIVSSQAIGSLSNWVQIGQSTHKGNKKIGVRWGAGTNKNLKQIGSKRIQRLNKALRKVRGRAYGYLENEIIMRIEIENSIIECLGNPTEKSISGNTHYLNYFKEGQCKLSFIISNNRLSFFLDDTGPILEDKNVNTVKEVKELLKEMIVILKTPLLKQTI